MGMKSGDLDGSTGMRFLPFSVLMFRRAYEASRMARCHPKEWVPLRRGATPPLTIVNADMTGPILCTVRLVFPVLSACVDLLFNIFCLLPMPFLATPNMFSFPYQLLLGRRCVGYHPVRTDRSFPPVFAARVARRVVRDPVGSGSR